MRERGNVLKVLADLTERTGFTSAVRTVDEAVRLNATDPEVAAAAAKAAESETAKKYRTWLPEIYSKTFRPAISGSYLPYWKKGFR